MKRHFIFFLILALTSCGNRHERETSNNHDAYDVYISKNAETLFIIYTIADLGITTPNESFSATASTEFEIFRDHQAVEMVQFIAKNHGIDALPQLILHFSELPDFEPIHPFDSNSSTESLVNQYDDSLWVSETFVVAFKDFYRIANVEGFITKHQAIYHKTLSDVHRHLPSGDLIKAMESFYGIGHKSYVLIPTPTLFPTWGFGGRVQSNCSLHVFNTFGAQRFIRRSKGRSIIDFDSKENIQNISVHEFGHSFVNPIAEKPENREAIESFSHLFEPIREHMSRQGYNNWWICVVEHLVRLGEIRIAESLGDTKNAKWLRNNYTNKRNFIYLPHLENKIIEYENNQDKYQRFEDFFPELISVFAKI